MKAFVTLHLLAVLVLTTDRMSNAFVLLDGNGVGCTTSTHWNTHACPNTTCSITNRPVRLVCGNTNTPAEFSATSWGYWMWVRESTLNNALFINTDLPCSGPTGWLDQDSYSGNGLNDVTWVSGTICDSADAGGCMSSDSTDFCSPWSTHEHFVATDVRLKKTAPWNDPTADGHVGFMSCLSTGNWRERMAIHEVGHAYGLDHNNARPTVMRSVVTALGACNQAAGFHSQPDADAMAGVASLYGRNTNNLQNMSASPHFVSGSTLGVTVTDVPAYCGGTIPFTVTLFNYYAPVPQWRLNFIFVPDGQVPAGGNIAWWSNNISVNNTPTNFNFAYNTSVEPSIFAFSYGVQYRLWIRIDPLNVISETDEGDNLIPTAITLTRGGGC